MTRLHLIKFFFFPNGKNNKDSIAFLTNLMTSECVSSINKHMIQWMIECDSFVVDFQTKNLVFSFQPKQTSKYIGLIVDFSVFL